MSNLTIEEQREIVRQFNDGIHESEIAHNLSLKRNDVEDYVMSYCEAVNANQNKFFNFKIKAKTPNQKTYIKNIKQNQITFAHGPSGTGKTYIAIGLAAQYLKESKINKIVLCRPLIPTGKDIGYLPGGIDSKMMPYLKPLMEELKKFLPVSVIKEFIYNETIEICPLATMRGRTMDDSFVILDEAQNAGLKELRMLMTRIGENCKMVITGDVLQTDLNRFQSGALSTCIDRLNHIDEISVSTLNEDDIVRNPIIIDIEEAIGPLCEDN